MSYGKYNLENRKYNQRKMFYNFRVREIKFPHCNIESCLRVIESSNLGASAITNVYISEE